MRWRETSRGMVVSRGGVVTWRVLLCCMMAFAGFPGWGGEGRIVPSRSDLLKAEPNVREATKDLLEGLARGEMTRAEVAEEVRIMGSQTGDLAEEYLLLQGAFRLFVRDGAYVRAAEMLRHMREREFPVEALVDLVEGALEPVPRGVDTEGLDESLRNLREALARERCQAAENGIARGLETVLLPARSADATDTFPEFLEHVRTALRAEGKPVFRFVLRCPRIGTGDGRFPVVPVGNAGNVRLSSALARVCGMDDYAMRVHGPLRFFTRTAPIGPDGPLRSVAFAGDAEATARRMKRIRLGFVAFDGNEPLDVAVERLLRAVVDQGRLSDGIDFDVVLRAAPDGRFPCVQTLRAADTTLYDAISLLCTGAGCDFRIRGDCVVISSI